MTFNSGSNWKVIKEQLKETQSQLQKSQETLNATKATLEKVTLEFEKMKIQKDLLIHRRDSLLFDFKKKNAKGGKELQRIKDSIKATNDKLVADKALIKSLFGVN